jgi:hypothetical protein
MDRRQNDVPLSRGLLLMSYLPRTVSLPDGRTINYIGQSGHAAYTVFFEDVPLTSAYMAEVQECYTFGKEYS